MIRWADRHNRGTYRGGLACPRVNTGLQPKCLSYDMTSYLVRDRLLGERSVELGDVRFLDTLITYNDGDKTILRSHLGNSAAIDLDV